MIKLTENSAYVGGMAAFLMALLFVDSTRTQRHTLMIYSMIALAALILALIVGLALIRGIRPLSNRPVRAEGWLALARSSTESFFLRAVASMIALVIALLSFLIGALTIFMLDFLMSIWF